MHSPRRKRTLDAGSVVPRARMATHRASRWLRADHAAVGNVRRAGTLTDRTPGERPRALSHSRHTCAIADQSAESCMRAKDDLASPTAQRARVPGVNEKPRQRDRRQPTPPPSRSEHVFRLQKARGADACLARGDRAYQQTRNIVSSCRPEQLGLHAATSLGALLREQLRTAQTRHECKGCAGTAPRVGALGPRS